MHGINQTLITSGSLPVFINFHKEMCRHFPGVVFDPFGQLPGKQAIYGGKPQRQPFSKVFYIHGVVKLFVYTDMGFPGVPLVLSPMEQVGFPEIREFLQVSVPIGDCLVKKRSYFPVLSYLFIEGRDQFKYVFPVLNISHCAVRFGALPQK